LHIGDNNGSVSRVDISFPPVRIGEVNRKGLLSQMYVPEFSPVLNEVFIGRDGAVWMSAIYEKDIWHVIVDGERQMRVSADSLQGARIKSVSATTLWAVATDSLGVPSIRRYNGVPVARERSNR
jgi:hypothetical protein